MKKFLKTTSNEYISINHITNIFVNIDYDVICKINDKAYEISNHKSKKKADLALIDLVAWIEEDKSRWEENNQWPGEIHNIPQRRWEKNNQ